MNDADCTIREYYKLHNSLNLQLYSSPDMGPSVWILVLKYVHTFKYTFESTCALLNYRAGVLVLTYTQILCSVLECTWVPISNFKETKANHWEVCDYLDT